MGEAEIVLRRRKWGPEEKAALLAEVEAEGGRVSVVARRHDLSSSLLYNWRSAWKAAASMRMSEAAGFVPIGVLGGASDESTAMLTGPDGGLPGGRHGRQARVGTIEIALPSGARVAVDALVNEAALARVFRALRGLR